MISTETRKKIHNIELRIKKILNGTLIGNQSTYIKGTGVEFDQIRDYSAGDDVRFIDWKSSAKVGKLLVKQYFEERDRNIVIALDVSQSTKYYSINVKKYDVMSQVAAILALIAQNSRDNIGLMLFSNQVHKFLYPKQGNSHICQIMNEIFLSSFDSSRTNINLALKSLIKNVKKDSIIFLISDFIDEQNFETNLKILSKKAQFIPIRCIDKNEKQLPNVGILTMQDFETGKEMVINLNEAKNINYEISRLWNCQNKNFNKFNIKVLHLNSDGDYLHEIVHFFKYLMLY